MEYGLVEVAKYLDGGQELVEIRFDVARVVPVVGVQKRVENRVLPFRVFRKPRVDREVCVADVRVERGGDQQQKEDNRVCRKGDLESPRENRVHHLLQQEQRVVKQAAEEPPDEPERPRKRPEKIDRSDLFHWRCERRYCRCNRRRRWRWHCVELREQRRDGGHEWKAVQRQRQKQMAGQSGKAGQTVEDTNREHSGFLAFFTERAQKQKRAAVSNLRTLWCLWQDGKSECQTPSPRIKGLSCLWLHRGVSDQIRGPRPGRAFRHGTIVRTRVASERGNFWKLPRCPLAQPVSRLRTQNG